MNNGRSLTVVSLFAGVGGFDLAFERAGAKVVAAIEIDRCARSVLERQFPDTTLFPDVTKVTADELRATGFVPDRGILTAGFPCQDISVAGRGGGLAGARSGLFWHIPRLLAELRPRWVVLENVPRLLSINDGDDMAAVLGSLAELGYGFAYRVLDAKYFGVPQQRRRLFIVGHLGEPFDAAAQVLFEPESGVGDSAPSGEAWPGTSECAAVGAGIAGEDGIDTHTHTTTLQGGGKRGYRIDAEAAAGNQLIVTKALEIGAEGGPYNALRAGDGGSSRQSLIAVTSRDTVVRRLTPKECERLQGFPDDWTDGQSDANRYRQMGNAVAVPVVEWIARRLIAADEDLA